MSEEWVAHGCLLSGGFDGLDLFLLMVAGDYANEGS